MARDASDLAHRLAREAEAVCRHYLSNGRRQGNYWLVGDVRNTPGRSMFVRLKGGESGKGAAGKWTDARGGGSWRSARRDPGKLRACRLSRCRWGGPAFSQPATIGARTGTAASAGVGCNGIAGIGAAAVRHVAADCGHSQRRPICASAASRLCMEPRVFVSIRAAITGRAMTRRRRIGRR